MLFRSIPLAQPPLDLDATTSLRALMLTLPPAAPVRKGACGLARNRSVAAVPMEASAAEAAGELPRERGTPTRWAAASRSPALGRKLSPSFSESPPGGLTHPLTGYCNGVVAVPPHGSAVYSGRVTGSQAFARWRGAPAETEPRA